MQIAVPDFTHLSAVQFATILIAIAAFDWLSGVLGALAVHHDFSWPLVLQVISTHGKFVAGIGAAFAIGQAAGSVAIVALADGALAIYFVQTFQSALSNVTSSTPAT